MPVITGIQLHNDPLCPTDMLNISQFRVYIQGYFLTNFHKPGKNFLMDVNMG
jgi:hypothetical protein